MAEKELKEKIVTILEPYMRIGIYPQRKWANEQADSILTLIRTKVEGIENPYQENIESDMCEGFIKAIDAVLEVLK